MKHAANPITTHLPLAKPLLVNGGFSASCAVFFAFGHEALQADIPLSSFYWLLIAAGLALFSGQLVLMAGALLRQSSWLNSAIKLTPSVVISDILWVVGSSMLAAIFFDQISSFGLVLIFAVNVLVACLAFWQYQGLQIINSVQAD